MFVSIMDANIVYQVVQALSKEEQKVLFEKLKDDFQIHIKKKNQVVFNKQDALHFLLKNVFSTKK